MNSEKSMDSVKVAIRIRPLISRENGSEILWTGDTHQVKLKEGKSKPYIFDRVFDSDETTSDVYEEIVQPIVQSAMTGFNGTVFAYGQTSSGKTYTMMGDKMNPGILPLSINETFQLIQKTPVREFLLRVSYMEIYNEVVRDLLSSSSESNIGLSIREDEFRNVVVHGLTEKLVVSPTEVLKFMEVGEKKRQTGCTNMNERSSRSHTIFRMIIESRERVNPNHTRDSLETDTAVMVSQLNLIDLAGSERAGQTGTEGQRFKEGCHINKSLSTLGLVINQICKANESGQSTQFISYRDSKLTRILQPSLGGNSLTAILCAVTPASLEDTDSTLRFASSAKKIKNKPHVNEVLSDEALLFKQKREINQLKKKISEMELQTKKQHTSEFEEILAEKNRLQKEQEEKIEMLKKIILVSTNPADAVKKQRSARRETWCPGALASANLNPVSLSALDLDTTISNKSLYFLEKLDQSTVCPNITLTTSPLKRLRFRDECEVISSKKICPAGSKEEEDAGDRFILLEDELTNMRCRQEELENEVEKYKALNSKHIHEKENLEHKVSLLKGKVQSLDELIEDQTLIEEEKEKLEAELKEQRQSLTQYMIKEKEWLTSGPDFADMKDQLQDTCHQNRILQEKTDSLQDLIYRLESTLNEHTQEADETRKSKDSEIEHYKVQVSTLQMKLENSDAQDRNASVDQNIIQELESKLKCKSTELEDQMRMNDNLRMNLDEMKLQANEKTTQQEGNFAKEIDDLKNELMKLHQEIICKDELIENLKREQIHTTAHNSSGIFGEKTINDLMTTSEELLAERNEARGKCEKLRSELDETKNLVVQLKQDIDSLEEHQEFIKSERDVIYMQEQESAEEIAALNKRLSQQEYEVDRLQKKMRDSEGNEADLSEDHHAELQSLKEELCNALRSSEDAQCIVQDVQQKLAQVTDERDELNIEKEKTDKEIKRLQSDVDGFTALSEITKDKFEARIKEMAQQLQAAYDQLDRQPIETAHENIELSKEDENLIVEREKSIQDLQQQLKETEIHLQEKDEKAEEVSKVNMQLQEKISMLESALQNQDEKIPEHEEGSHTIASHPELAVFMKEHNLDLETLKEKLEELEMLLASKKELVGEIQSKEESIIQLKKLLEQQNQDLESLQSTNDIVDQLKSCLEEKNKELNVMHEASKNTSDSAEELQQLVQVKDEELSELQAKLRETSDLLDQRDKSIEELKTSVHDLTGKEDLENHNDVVFASGDASERTLREELASTRKELAEMCNKYDRLLTETHHAQGALLAETNRELDQKRLLDIAEKERKESVVALASERDSSNKQMNQLLTKVGEVQSLLCLANCDKDVLTHQNNKLNEECEFLRQQVRELEKIHQNESSILPRNSAMDPDKMLIKIKQLSLNLELTKQTSDKLNVANKKLQDENKRLEGEYIRAMNLKSEVTSLQAILEQERQSRTEEISRLKVNEAEVNGMRTRIVELQEDLKKREASFNEQAKLASDKLESASSNENNLREELANVKQALSFLEEKLQLTKEAEKDSLSRVDEEEKRIAELTDQLVDKEKLLKEQEVQLASLQDRLDHSIKRLDKDKEMLVELESTNSSLISDLDNMQIELEEKKNHAVEEANKRSLLEQSLEHVKKQLELVKSDAVERQVFEEEQAKFQALLLEKEELSSQNTELENQIQSSNRDMENLQAVFKNTQDELSEVKNAAVLLEERLQSMIATEENSLACLQENDEKIKELSSQLEEKERLVEEQMSQVKSLQDRLDLTVKCLEEEKEKFCGTECNSPQECHLVKTFRDFEDKQEVLERVPEGISKDEEVDLVTLLNKKNELLDLNAKLEIRLAESNQHLTHLQASIKKQENEINEKDATYTDERLANLQAVISQLQNENNMLISKIQKLEGATDEQNQYLTKEALHKEEEQNELASLETKLKLANQNYDSSTEMVNELQLKLDKIQQENEALRLTVPDQANENNAFLAEKIEMLENELQMLRETDSHLIIQNLKLEVEELKFQAIPSVQTDMLSCETSSLSPNEVESLKLELANKKEEIDKYQNEVVTLKSQISKLEDTLSNARESSGYYRECSMEDDGIGFAASLDQEMIESLTEKVADFKLQLQEKEEQINDMMQEMDKLRSEKAKLLARQLTDNISEDEVSLEETDVIQMKNKLLTLQKSLQREDARMAALKEAKQAVEEEFRAVRVENEKQIAQLNLELKNKGDEITALLEDMELLKAQSGDSTNISQISEEKYKLNEELEKLRLEVDKKQKKIDKLSKLVESKKEEMEIPTSDVDSCKTSDQNAHDSSRDVILQLEHKLSELRASKENISEELETTKQEKEEYSQSLIILEEENNNMKRTSQELEQEFSDLQASLENIGEELEKAKQEKEECSQTLMKLEKENVNLKMTLQELETQKEQELSDLKSSLENIGEELEKAKQEREEYSQSLIRLQNENDNLAKSLQELENEKEQELSDLKASLQNVNQELEKKQQQWEECSQSIMKLEKEKNEMKITLSELESQKILLEEKCIGLQQSLTVAETQVKEHESSLTQSSEDNLELQETLRKLNKDKNDLDQERQKSQFDLEEIKTVLKNRDIEEVHRKNEILELEKELANQKMKAFDHENELNSVYDMIRSKATEMEESAISREKLERDIEKLTQENHELRVSYEELRNSANISEDLKGGLERAEKRVRELDEQVSEVTKSNDSLKLSLEKAQKCSAELHEELVKITDTNENIRNLLEMAECRNRTLDEEIFSLKESVKDVQNCLEKAEKQNTETSEDILKMKTSYQDLRRDYFDFLSTIGNEIEIEDLPASEESKDIVLQRLKVTLEDLKKTISDCNEKINLLEKEKDDSDRSKTESNDLLEKYKQKCCDLEIRIEADEKSWDSDIRDKAESMLVLKEELEALKAKLESTHADKDVLMAEIEKLKAESEQKDHKLRKLDFSEKELQDLQEKLSATKNESDCSLEKLKGILYKKELELQTLQTEAIKMSEHYEERKASWKETIDTMKEEMRSQEAESRKNTEMLESQLKGKLQPKEYNDLKTKLAEAMQKVNDQKDELCKVSKILEEKKAAYSELIDKLEASQAELKEVKEKQSKVCEKLHSRIDYLEQACFEADEEMEVEKKKVEELESKLKSSGKVNRDYPQNDRAKEFESLRTMYSATEKKYKDTKEKWQNIAEKLKAEQHKCSQLKARLIQATAESSTKPKESEVDTSQLTKQLYFEKQNCRELKDKLELIEKEHSKNILDTEERYRERRRFLMSRITTMEQHCIDADEEVQQEKKITEEWKERVWELEKKVHQLEESLQSIDKDEKSLTLLEEELKSKEQMIVDLKEKLESFISSEKRNQHLKESNGMENSSSVDQKDIEQDKLQQQRPKKLYAGGSGGLVVSNTKVYVLEMEILNLHKRIKFLEKELAKYKDVETKRRSENVELLEENKKLRTIVKKVRDSRSSTPKVLQEQKTNCSKANEENTWSFANQEEIPASSDKADEKCKSQ